MHTAARRPPPYNEGGHVEQQHPGSSTPTTNIAPSPSSSPTPTSSSRGSQNGSQASWESLLHSSFAGLSLQQQQQGQIKQEWTQDGMHKQRSVAATIGAGEARRRVKTAGDELPQQQQQQYAPGLHWTSSPPAPSSCILSPSTTSLFNPNPTPHSTNLPSPAAQSQSQCELCGIHASLLTLLRPCGHKACSSCTSSGLNQVSTSPPRQHCCAACKAPVMGIELYTSTAAAASGGGGAGARKERGAGVSPPLGLLSHHHQQPNFQQHTRTLTSPPATQPSPTQRIPHSTSSPATSYFSLSIHAPPPSDSLSGAGTTATTSTTGVSSLPTPPLPLLPRAATSPLLASRFSPASPSSNYDLPSPGFAAPSPSLGAHAVAHANSANSGDTHNPWEESMQAIHGAVVSGDIHHQRQQHGEQMSKVTANTTVKCSPETLCVVRVDNIPWTIHYDDVVRWIPPSSTSPEDGGHPTEANTEEEEGTLSILPPASLVAQAIHIPIDVSNGKTSNACFIECTSRQAAMRLIRMRNNTRLAGRPVSLIHSSYQELLSEVFPARVSASSAVSASGIHGPASVNGRPSTANSGGHHSCRYFTSKQLDSLIALSKGGALQLKDPGKPIEYLASVVGLVPSTLSMDQTNMLFDTVKQILGHSIAKVAATTAASSTATQTNQHLRSALDRLLASAGQCAAFTVDQRLELIDHAKIVLQRSSAGGSPGYVHSAGAMFPGRHAALPANADLKRGNRLHDPYSSLRVGADQYNHLSLQDRQHLYAASASTLSPPMPSPVDLSNLSLFSSNYHGYAEHNRKSSNNSYGKEFDRSPQSQAWGLGLLEPGVMHAGLGFLGAPPSSPSLHSPVSTETPSPYLSPVEEKQPHLYREDSFSPHSSNAFLPAFSQGATMHQHPNSASPDHHRLPGIFGSPIAHRSSSTLPPSAGSPALTASSQFLSQQQLLSSLQALQAYHRSRGANQDELDALVQVVAQSVQQNNHISPHTTNHDASAWSSPSDPYLSAATNTALSSPPASATIQGHAYRSRFSPSFASASSHASSSSLAALHPHYRSPASPSFSFGRTPSPLHDTQHYF